MKVADLYAALSLKWDKVAASKAGKELTNFAKKTRNKVADIAKDISKRFGAMFTIGAAALATRDALKFNEALARLEITAKGGLGSLEQMQARILRISDATGVAKEQVLAGTSRFIELTGNVEMASQTMELFAKVTQATGASAEDVAGSAAAMSEQFKVSGADFEKMFSILIEGGKAGSAEFKDMAGHMAGIGAAAQKFAGSEGIEAAAQISAMLQTVAGTTGGNIPEASTQLKAMFSNLGAAAKELKKHKVDVFDASGEYRNLADILGEIKAKDFSPKQLEEIFTNVRAQRGILALLRNDWEGLADETLASNALAEDYAKINQSAAIKVSKAWNKFKNLIVRIFAKVIDVFAFAIEHIEKIGIAVGALAAAFTILQFQAVKAGMALVATAVKAAAAWALALAPIVLLALAIGAAIFVVWDLWKAFTGGESILRNAHEWLVDVFVEAIKFWVDQFNNFFDWIAGKFEWVADKAKGALNFVTGGIGGGATGLAAKALKAKNAPRINVADYVSAGLAAQVQGAAGNTGISTSLVVNVEAGANVTPDTVKSITDQTQAAMERTSRQLASEAQ